MAKVSPSVKPQGEVAKVYAGYPPKIRTQLLKLRKLLLQTAKQSDGVGAITETLKWGEPSYLTEATKSGSTVRLAWRAKYPDQIGIFVNCQTSLISTIKALYGDRLQYEGKRAILFEAGDTLPMDILSHCFELTLRYHLDKKAQTGIRGGSKVGFKRSA